MDNGTAPISPELERRTLHLRGVVENPPEHARAVAGMYRGAIAKRQAAEKKVATAQATIRSAQAALQAAEIERIQAIGAEGALHDALFALCPLPVQD